MTPSPASRLVWVPHEITELADRAPAELVLVPIPDDPARDSGIGDVEMLLADFRCDLAAIFPLMSSLQVVQFLAVGVDRVLPTIPPHLTLCSTKGVADVPVSEWIVAAILGAEKDLLALHAEQLSGDWNERGLRLLADETVLIIGSGSMGRATVERLAPFGCEVHQLARRARPGVETLEALPRLVRTADVIVVLVPLTEETEGLISAELLAMMKPGSLIVNAARGAVVDHDALLAALTTGRVRAVLDVTVPEPLPPDHPLRFAPGVLVTPHVAGIVGLGHRLTTDFLLAQFERFARGEPLANVIGSDGY